MFVGIDWASQTHAVCVLDDAGTKHANFQVGHTADGLDQLIARLGRLGDPATLPVAIERRGPLGQPGLSGLQRLLGFPGPCLSRPDPGIVDGQGRDPLALGRLDDLLGEVGHLARGRPGPFSELLERVVRAGSLGGGQHAFGLLDPDPTDQGPPQLGHLNLTVGQFHPGADQLGGHHRQRPQRLDLGWRPCPRLGGIHIQGPDRLVGQPHRHTQHPRTCSWPTTAAIRSQTSSLRRSWTATTRSST